MACAAPPAMAGSQRACWAGVPAASMPSGRHDGLEVRPRERDAPQLLEDDGGLHHAESAPAVGLRKREAEPAEPRELLPEIVALPARIVPQRADDGRRHVLVEERAGGAAQELLVRAEGEVHAPRS